VRRSEKSPGKAPERRADGIPNPPLIQPGQCRVAYISEMGATGMTTAFHATGRFARNIASRAPRSAKVLMDPGADVNLIRTSIVTGVTKSSTLKVLSTRHSPTDLFNNGVKIGHVENEHEVGSPNFTRHNVLCCRLAAAAPSKDSRLEERQIGERSWQQLKHVGLVDCASKHHRCCCCMNHS
jgi:hypothetical protein